MHNASQRGTHIQLLCPNCFRIPSAHVLRGRPVYVASEQGELETAQEPVELPQRKTVIIKRASKAPQTRPQRTKTASRDAEGLLKAVTETLEWYFRPAWPRDKEAVLRHIHISRGFSVPLDLFLGLRRLKRVMRLDSPEEERELIEKALNNSNLLELSEDGRLVQKRDIAEQHNVSIMIVVAGALINEQGQILLSQRKLSQSFSGKWEFPGGKVHPYEVPEAALVRELKEELSIEVDVQDLEPLTFGSQRHGDCHILMPLYLCKRWKGDVTGNEGQEVEWCSAADLKGRDMPPGNISVMAAVEKAVHEHAQTAISIAA